MKKALKVIFWIIAFVLFPIVAGLYFIWPSRLFKDKMNKGWRVLGWVIYAMLAKECIILKVGLYLLLVCASGSGSLYDPISDYQTSEDFYKLTGVEFPELEMVDSLYYDDMCLNPNTYHEYKFVVKEVNKNFYRRLASACKSDSTHWRYNEAEDIYSYWIYPDQHPVDRSRGMCDRMVKREDGRLTEDWDGDFISVDVQRDTIILRKGWVR